MRKHIGRDMPNDWHDDGISKLSVGLGIGNRDLERLREAHETSALPWRKPSRIRAPAVDKNFGAVLVIPGGKRSRDSFASHLAVAEAVPSGLMLLGISLKIVPELC